MLKKQTRAQSQSNKMGFYQLVLVNAVIYRSGMVKARNGSVYKHLLDFYHLTMVNARIYQSSGFYSNTYIMSPEAISTEYFINPSHQ
jgi:fucose permease